MNSIVKRGDWMNPVPLGQAIALYVGAGASTFPIEDETNLIARFGDAAGRDFAMRIRALLDELDKIQPDWDHHTLETASKWAVQQLRNSHPEIDDTGASALEWTYSWWWR